MLQGAEKKRLLFGSMCNVIIRWGGGGCGMFVDEQTVLGHQLTLIILNVRGTVQVQ